LFVPVRVQGQQGEAELFVVAYEGAGGGAFHFIMISKPGGDAAVQVNKLFQSFHLLSQAEVEALRPRQIRVVTVGPTDTAQSLSAGMASDNRLDHFLMLNGRTGDQKLRPGELVKLVRFAGQ
jgi:predicted Zn-dependent protease